MNSISTRRSFRTALIVAALAVPVPAMATLRFYVGPDNGNWSNAANWSPGAVPVNGDNVSINPSAGDRNVFMDVNYAAPGIASLYVDGLNSTTATVTQSANTLIDSGSEQIGSNGRGRYVQSGGTHTVGGQGIFLGLNPGSSGSYDLSGVAILNVNANSSMTTTVGGVGSGVFTQTGGTHNVYQLEVGARFANGSGNYSISLGSLNATNIFIGGLGNGYFNQNGGTIGVGFLSNDINGTYNLNDGNLNVSTSFINSANYNQNHGFFTGSVINNGSLSLAGGGMTINGSGLTNNATLNLSGGFITANATLTNNGQISFYGNPSIGGTSIFNNVGQITEGSGTLTISPSSFNSGNITLAPGGGLSLNGSNMTNFGTINLGGGRITGGPQLINRYGATITGSGQISALYDNQGGRLMLTSGTTLISNAFNNSGIIQLTDDAASLTGGAITNTSEIIGHGSIANPISSLGGGIIESSGGTLILSGVVTNGAGGTLSATAGSKLFITGGISTSGGLINLTGGYFDNNTFALSNTGQISGFGTIRTGGLTNNGSVTLTGGFTTVMGNVTNAATRQIKVAYNPAIFTGNVTNNGIFKSTSTTVTFSGTYTENGTFISDPADNFFNNVNIGPAGAWVGGLGDRFFVSGDFLNQSTSSAWDTKAAELHLLLGGEVYQVNGQDLGVSFDGYDNNFAWGTLSLASGRSLTLLDANTTPGGAVYVDHLDLQGGLSQIANITGNGMTLYYSLGNPDNAYLGGKSYALAAGGSISPVPEPATLLLSIIGAPLLLARRSNRRVCFNTPRRRA